MAQSFVLLPVMCLPGVTASPLLIPKSSLLISSAFAAYATVRYFTGQEEPDVNQNGVPSIAPDEAAWFETDDRDI
jgi:hypothetical protein